MCCYKCLFFETSDLTPSDVTCRGFFSGRQSYRRYSGHRSHKNKHREGCRWSLSRRDGVVGRPERCHRRLISSRPYKVFLFMLKTKPATLNKQQGKAPSTRHDDHEHFFTPALFTCPAATFLPFEHRPSFSMIGPCESWLIICDKFPFKAYVFTENINKQNQTSSLLDDFKFDLC